MSGEYEFAAPICLCSAISERRQPVKFVWTMRNAFQERDNINLISHSVLSNRRKRANRNVIVSAEALVKTAQSAHAQTWLINNRINFSECSLRARLGRDFIATS